MKMYITLGQSHVHEIQGKILDHDCIIEVEVGSIEDGEKKAISFFGDKFATTYSEKDLIDEDLIRFFPSGIVKI